MPPTTDPHRRDRLPDALRHFDDLPASAFVRRPVVEALFACSSTTVYRRVAAGLIPKPEKLGPNISAWRVGDLRKVLKRPGRRSAR